MALPIAALLAAQAAGRTLGGVGQAVSTIGSARQAFTRDDKRRLKELEEEEAAGELGLSEVQREGIRGEGASQRGALLRQQEAQSAKQAAMQPTLTGRDIFLREQAAAQTAEGAEAAIRQTVTEADIAAESAQRSEIAALRGAQKARKAGIAAGIGQVLGAAGEGAAAAAGQAASLKFQADLEAAKLEKDLSDQELLQSYLRSQGIQGGYSTRAPRSK